MEIPLASFGRRVESAPCPLSRAQRQWQSVLLWTVLAVQLGCLLALAAGMRAQTERIVLLTRQVTLRQRQDDTLAAMMRLYEGQRDLAEQRMRLLALQVEALQARLRPREVR